MSELSYAEVTALVCVDFKSGKLFWKPRPSEYFSSKRSASIWNVRFAGKQAASLSKDGYTRIRILGKSYLAHRVVWLLHSGEWPENQIDHINGSRSDNRLINLRNVSSAENNRNKAIRKDNTSGVPGVYWSRAESRWRAKSVVDGKWTGVGYTRLFEHAVAKRRTAEASAEFHPNHGRPA